ncbi:hypothetical protein F5Y14DRAFT_8128 [Nemania sp. NC0429]|nr:hypothetical protein F5Y14DRAFT_8128 [Nemania sp. NC0429]
MQILLCCFRCPWTCRWWQVVCLGAISARGASEGEDATPQDSALWAPAALDQELTGVSWSTDYSRYGGSVWLMCTWSRIRHSRASSAMG